MINSLKIKGRMMELRIGQKDLARELGIAQSTLSLKLGGQRPLCVDEAEAMASILHIPDEEMHLYFFAKR